MSKKTKARADANDVRELLDWVHAKGWGPHHTTSILATATMMDIVQNTSDARDALACFAHVWAELTLMIPDISQALKQEKGDGKSAVH